MSSRRLHLGFAAAIGLVLALGGLTVVAAGGDVADKFLVVDQEYTIESSETVDHDLYVFGGTIVVDGTVDGDLTVGAGTLVVNGQVTGDVLVGSGSVEINGEVGGDVRAGSGGVTVSGVVAEDLVVAAGQIHVAGGGEVGEDFIFTAGDVVIDGTVAGSVLGSADRYANNGEVGGTENVSRPEGPAPEDPTQPAPPPDPLEVAGAGLVQFITVVILGGLWLLLLPGSLRASDSALRRRPLASAGIGIGLIVGFLIQIIAVVLLMILVAIAFSSVALDALSGIGIWLGIIDILVTTFAFIVSCAFLVDAVVGLALARLAMRDWARNRWMEFALLVAGVLAVVIVTSLPVIGGIAKLVVIVLGLGAMGVAFGEWWTRRNPPAPVAFAASPTPPNAPVDTVAPVAPSIPAAVVTAPEAPPPPAPAPKPRARKPKAPSEPPTEPPAEPAG
jgi:hypothetical protein